MMESFHHQQRRLVQKMGRSVGGDWNESLPFLCLPTEQWGNEAARTWRTIDRVPEAGKKSRRQQMLITSAQTLRTRYTTTGSGNFENWAGCGKKAAKWRKFLKLIVFPAVRQYIQYIGSGGQILNVENGNRCVTTWSDVD
ncbi:MAG: hypothetical protein ACK5RR_00120 [Acidobacteriota bacterium]